MLEGDSELSAGNSITKIQIAHTSGNVITVSLEAPNPSAVFNSDRSNRSLFLADTQGRFIELSNVFAGSRAGGRVEWQVDRSTHAAQHQFLDDLEFPHTLLMAIANKGSIQDPNVEFDFDQSCVLAASESIEVDDLETDKWSVVRFRALDGGAFGAFVGHITMAETPDPPDPPQAPKVSNTDEGALAQWR